MPELELSPQPVQEKFLNEDSHLVLFGGGGGGGKTWSILADNILQVNDPNYFSVFFRKTTNELETNLWPEALKMYKPLLEYQEGLKKGKFIGKAWIRDKDKTITFPSGAKSRFSYMQYDKDADSWYGSELSRVYFDEFQTFSDYQYNVIRSRMRSKAKVKSAMRCTLNPDQNHFCYDYVKRFLDDEGFPKPELSGKQAYFLIVRGELYTSWNEDELREKFGKNPKTYTYIPSTLEDNKILLELEPDYKDTLDSLPEDKRKQLLLGCWHTASNEKLNFNRDFLLKATSVPDGSKACRAWDKASMEPNESERFPDYTASAKIWKSKDGFYYLTGDYHPSNTDGNEEPMGKFRKSVGKRDNLIHKQSEWDGTDCTVVFSTDPGQAGKVEFQESAKKLVQEGFIVKSDPMPPTKSKLLRFQPFSSACENGLVYVVESTFDKQTLEAIYRELEMFNGERSTRKRKDD